MTIIGKRNIYQEDCNGRRVFCNKMQGANKSRRSNNIPCCYMIVIDLNKMELLFAAIFLAAAHPAALFLIGRKGKRNAVQFALTIGRCDPYS